MTRLLNGLRAARILAKRALRIEPSVNVQERVPLEFHGNNYCGWSIPRNSIDPESVIVDVGLGEDISFSKSLIDTYGCTVHGFDPTPRAVRYVKGLNCRRFVLHEYGLAGTRGPATFYLPNNEAHVSGSLVKEGHVGNTAIEVQLLTATDLFESVGAQRITLLKIDIEGAEFDLIGSDAFRVAADRIDMLCIEFHHRWPAYGSKATVEAVRTLNELGYACVWGNRTSNEEFTFVGRHAIGRPRS